MSERIVWIKGGRHLALLSLLLLLLVSPIALLTAADEMTQPEKSDPISFAGSHTRASLKNGQESLLLTGGAWLTSGSIRIEADTIEIFGQNSRYVQARGAVRLDDSERDLTIDANMINLDRQDSSLTINGWVEMSDRKNEIVARGSYLRNDQNTGIIMIQIGVSIAKITEDGIMYCRADSAVYDSEQELLELTGQAVVELGSSNYRAARILVDLTTNDVTLTGKVSGSIDGT